MHSITNTSLHSSEQCKDFGRSRCQRDYEDSLKFHDWLTLLNSFNVQDAEEVTSGSQSKLVLSALLMQQLKQVKRLNH